MKDTEWLNKLAHQDREATLAAKHALVSEYEAGSMGAPDPEWKGRESRGIQDLRFQSAILANMAIWLIQPSIVSFTVGFHALTKIDTRPVDPPIILRSEREGRLFLSSARPA